MEVPPGELRARMHFHMASAQVTTARADVQSKLKDGGVGLIIVDVQNDFCEGGSLAVPHASRIIPIINQLRSARAWDAIILTQDWHPPSHASFGSNNPGSKLFTEVELPGIGKQMMWPDHCVQGSHGAAFHASLQRTPDDVIVRKGKNERVDSYSGFGDATGGSLERTELADVLQSKGITNVFVVGLATDYCVSATARDALKNGLNTFLVLDACAGIADESTGTALKSVQDGGGHVILSNAVAPA